MAETNNKMKKNRTQKEEALLNAVQEKVKELRDLILPEVIPGDDPMKNPAIFVNISLKLGGQYEMIGFLGGNEEHLVKMLLESSKSHKETGDVLHKFMKLKTLHEMFGDVGCGDPDCENCGGKG